MRIAIRVDASSEIGTGHLRRCMALAQALKEQDADVLFVVRALDNVAKQVLDHSDFPLNWLPPSSRVAHDGSSQHDLPPHHAWARVGWQQDANETCASLASAPPDWLVVDHYAFDARWHDAVRQALSCRLMVIDDLADRPLAADVLVDHNWADDHRAKYQLKMVSEPGWLVGPRYALLSAAYRLAPRYAFKPVVESIGIFMGGTDPNNITAKVLDCVRRQVGFAGPVEVASTTSNPNLTSLRAVCHSFPDTSLLLDEPDLAAFFVRHDLQIGAGGGATWERCCIGVPTIALAVAANQIATLPWLHALGAVRAACFPGASPAEAPVNFQPLADELRVMLDDKNARQRVCSTAAALVDGRGAQRVGLRLMRDVLEVRQATMIDAPMLHAWRNHPSVRGVSGNSAPIAYADHVSWMEAVLRATNRWLLVGQIGQLAVGCLRFDKLGARTFEVSLYLDPALVGLGLGRPLLLAGEEHIFHKLGTDLSIVAIVMPGNRSSCGLFESCEYQGGPTRYTKFLSGHRNNSEPIS